MTHYLVEWSIDIEADSAEEAARQALEIQRNPASMATVFRVYDDFLEETVDLYAIDEEKMNAQ